jgi:TonB family protein
MDAVSEILAERAREVDKFTGTVFLSMLMHAALIAAVALVPSRWDAAPDPANVMMISIGGPDGPLQGRNAISAPRVDEAVPEAAKPRTDAPPPVAKPEMIEPVKAAKPESRAVVKPKEEKPERSTRVNQGAEVKAGAARIETKGAAIPWGGLAPGGGGDGGITTDLADFCCPEYLTVLKRTIYGNWQQRQGQDGLNRVRFVISRDGSITDIQLEKSAGQFLDLASQRAVVQTQRLPPLPATFTPPRLTVHLEFEYKR